MRIGVSLCNAGRVIMWRFIDEGLTAIGRNPECDLCVPADEVPPILAVLRRENDALTLVNRDAHGTRVGAEVVTGELRLGDGDEIQVGPIVATVRFDRDGAASAGRGNTRTLTGTTPAAGRAWLMVPEALPGKIFELDERGLGAGSDAGNDVVLDDPYVSAFHARIALEDGRVIVRDLGSRNGVFVGERKIREGEVPSGVQLRLGRTIFVVGTGGEPNTVAAGAAAETRPLIGRSPVMEALRERIRRVATTGAPVLITGETGSGKEVVARLTAALSNRAGRSFHALNCGALSKSLIESELFGHEKGAFTGAVARKIGAFEAADGGTLFLDEVGELPLELQPQLLRVLETGEVRRVGGTNSFKVDVRLLAATNRRLEHEVELGNFREDLYHRLHVLVLELPSLRERREDISELANYFVSELAPPGDRVSLCAAALAKLVAHDWRGNVRELRNALQRAVLMRQHNEVSADDITFVASTLASRVQTASAVRQRTLYELERETIVAELIKHGGNKTEAAAALGLSRATIHRKIDQYGLDIEALLMGKES